MQAGQLIKLQFRFTEPADVQTYGDRWWVYDEAAIVRRPARELVKLEVEIGMALPAVINQMRDDLVMGTLAGTWLAIRLADPDIAGPFDVYSPVVLLTEWSKVPEPDEPKADLDPLDPTPETSSPDGPPTE